MAMLTLDKSTEVSQNIGEQTHRSLRRQFFHDCKPYTPHLPWLKTSHGREFKKNLWRESAQLFETASPGTLAAAGVRV